MKKIIILIYVLFSTLLFVSGEETGVRLYPGLSSELWGRSLSREEVLVVKFDDFRDTMSVPGPEGGFLTAVLLEGGLADLLYTGMNPGDSVSDGKSSFSLVEYNGKPVYRFRQDYSGLDILFTLERTPDYIIDSIERFYETDSYNRNLVLQEYRENRVIRILRGNDYKDRDGKLSFFEAMTAATVLGKTFQPFYGIHDGLGILRNIGYLLTERSKVKEDSIGPAEYSGVDEYEDFIFRAKGMEGSIPENIYILARTLCELKEGGDEYTSPEEFLNQRWGGSRDFALLFYSALKDFEYEVKLLRINSGAESPYEYMVVYRNSQGRTWGLMGAEYWTGERFGNWTRIPALYKGRTIKFQELDGVSILEGARWKYPGSGKWQDSFY